MTRSSLPRCLSGLCAALLTIGCGSAPAPAPDPDPVSATPPAAPPARPAGHDTPAPPVERAPTAVRFEVTAFATADGAAPAERVIPSTPGAAAQFWPGNSGDVLERQVGEITQLLGGDAISTGWLIGDAEALGKADHLVMKVVSVEPAPDALADGVEMARFSPEPTASDHLPKDGRWFRVRFFPDGVWKDAQVQGYLRMGDQGPAWFRVDGLIRGLYGPQSRDYRAGDLFELRASPRPDGIKLYPLK